MANKSARKPRKLTVYLFIPNIIVTCASAIGGYIRVLMNCVAFAICFSNKRLFSLLYFISFVRDGIDGWCARKFNQVSTFGAILDMVTDRISTACLLVILSQVYRPVLTFLLLLALNIASHRPSTCSWPHLCRSFTHFLQLFDRSGVLYGELARFVLRLLGVKTKPRKVNQWLGPDGLPLPGPGNPKPVRDYMDDPKAVHAQGSSDNVWGNDAN